MLECLALVAVLKNHEGPGGVRCSGAWRRLMNWKSLKRVELISEVWAGAGKGPAAWRARVVELKIMVSWGMVQLA